MLKGKQAVELTEEVSSDVFDACFELGLSIQQYADYASEVFMWMLRNAAEGRAIVGLDEKTGTYRELSIPPFDHVREG